MSTSFAGETKNDLCGVFLRKPCCRRAFLYGALLGCGRFEADRAALLTEHERFAALSAKMLRSAFHIDISARIHEEMRIPDEALPSLLSQLGYEKGEAPTQRICPIWKCEYDKGAFLRGVFLACGTVNMPDTSYHLELSPQPAAFRAALKDFLIENDLPPKVIKRTGRREESLYYKDSTAMEDFLNFIGAQRSAFTLMNVKIKRDIRNNANRIANCDMANIDKTITAAARQMEAIWRIADEGRADRLSPQLRQTFDLRAAYPDVNLAELAAMHQPPISKSGVSHRLSKLIAFAEQGEGETENGKREE